MEFGIVRGGEIDFSVHVSVNGGIEAFLSLVLADEFLWVVCLWSYLTAINYLGVHLNLDAFG